MARSDDVTIHLLHVEEGATSQLFGQMAASAEIQAGERYFEDIVAKLRRGGLKAETDHRARAQPQR